VWASGYDLHLMRGEDVNEFGGSSRAGVDV
jgi:hypothetical protein